MIKTAGDVIALPVKDRHQSSPEFIAQSNGAKKIAPGHIDPLADRESGGHRSRSHVPTGRAQVNRVYFIAMSHRTIGHGGADHAAPKIVIDDRAFLSVGHLFY